MFLLAEALRQLLEAAMAEFAFVRCRVKISKELLVLVHGLDATSAHGLVTLALEVRW